MTIPPMPPGQPALGSNKAIAATIAGGLCIIASWAVGAFTKVVVPPEVWASAQTVVVSALVYYLPHGG